MDNRTIAVLTGGGDCPGLNAAIRAIVKTAINDHGWKVIGILDGYEGLISGNMRELSLNHVANILPLGGTILGTSNKASPFDPVDVSDQVVQNLKMWNVDTLFCIGGDGTLSIAERLTKKYPMIIGVPKTIDNDLKATDQTFGFDTACSFVTEAIDRIHTTADSHHRVMVIEVMGRYAGWIGMAGGIAGGGDVILIPEMPFSFEKIAEVVNKRQRVGKRSTIVIVSEGARPIGEDYSVDALIKDSPDPIRLGGIGKRVALTIEKMTGFESRVTVLGHLQRGGSPTFFDRVLATRYGEAAVRLAEEENFGKMVALKEATIKSVRIKEAIDQLKLVPKDHPLVKMARSLGTSFGD